MSNTSHNKTRRYKRKRLYGQQQHATATPWKDFWEWQSVGQGLRGALDLIADGRIVIRGDDIDIDDDQQQDMQQDMQQDAQQGALQQALHTCEMWKARSSDPLPHAIECSYSLAQLLYTDSTTSTNTASCTTATPSSNDHMLQLSYSTTIIRSVNGLADRLQQQRRFTAPISQLCFKLGLPGWLVDVRHEAAHNALPSIQQLRLAAHTMLGFFCQRYWQFSHSRQEMISYAKQLLEAHLDPSTMPAQDDDEGKDVLTDQQSTQKTYANIDSDNYLLKDDDYDDGDDWLQSNFFAALYEPKKTKVVAAVVPVQEPDTPKQKLKNQKKKRPTIDTAPDNFGQRFVTKIPQDIAYQVALDFFVWGDNDATAEAGGILINCQSCEMYEPLLTLMCQTWPGFLGCLLTHCVEYRILHPWQANSDDSNHDSLATGVQRFLQNEFLTTLLPSGVQLCSPKMMRSRLPLQSLLSRSLLVDEPLRRVLQTYVKQADDSCDVTNWSIVAKWDASTIGSLPGHAI